MGQAGDSQPSFAIGWLTQGKARFTEQEERIINVLECFHFQAGCEEGILGEIFNRERLSGKFAAWAQFDRFDLAEWAENAL